MRFTMKLNSGMLQEVTDMQMAAENRSHVHRMKRINR